MPENPSTGLTANQQAMLDLALACDLKTSDPTAHPEIQKRHQNIKTQQDAANYIRGVENKIHSNRKYNKTTKSMPTTTTTEAVMAPLTPVISPAKTPAISGGQNAFAIIFLILLMVAAGWFAPLGLNLALVTLCMVLLLVVLGIAITKNPFGILINERNLMSLSRFQMAAWTVVVLGAFFTFAMMRIRAMAGGSLNGQAFTDPLNITVDWHLWTLLGISTTSLVGAPLILSTKRDKTPDPAATVKAAQMVNEPLQDVEANKQGTLYANTNISDARITDMFQGDELNNTAQIDLAKVQMFYFTIIAVVCFFVMVLRQLVDATTDLGSLPVLSDGFVAVLGISHGGYLTSKSISHTKSQP